jgi:DNA-binding response OmpR family regulator
MQTKKRILLVEDTETILNIYKTKLMTEQFDVTIARNGMEAIQAVSGQLFDVMLLDLMMPIVDGFKVLQVVKSDAKTEKIPIIVFSAKGQPQEIEKAMKLGAADYIVKSLTKPNDVVEKIRRLLDSEGTQKRVKHYRISIKDDTVDAPALSSDFKLNMFKCLQCGNALCLDLIPDYSHDVPWFTGHFVCPECTKIA